MGRIQGGDNLRIKDLRIERGWAQEYVARQVDVSLTAYNNWELGKSIPRANHLAKLADLYNVPVDYIMGRTENKIGVF